MRGAVRLVLTLVIATTIAACSRSAGSPDVPAGFMDQEAYATAIAERIDDYVWPAAYQPDAGKIADRGSGDGLFEDGFEQMTLTMLNTCSWYLTWLDAREQQDDAAAKDALDMMTDVIPTYPDFVSDPDGTAKRAEDQRLAKAVLGDPSMVQSFVTANCEPVYWTTTS